MRQALHTLWERWKRIALWIGEKQAAIVYTLLYVFVIGPVALVRKALRADPLQYRVRARSSFWVPRTPIPETLDAARRQ